MLNTKTTSQEKRAKFKKSLTSNKLHKFPGAFNPLIAKLIENIGFDGVYISGAVISNNLALPDIGLTTLSEVSLAGKTISNVTNLPSLIDADTGFGETTNVARTVKELELSGVSAIHMEDQQNPKRCGHLDNKVLVSVEEMTKKIKSAANARTDSNFLIMARTDSRAIEGLEASIHRAKSYIQAGADAIFPEALKDEKEFEKFRKEIDVPLLANMTEFGKSKLLDASTLENLGYNIVIYPVTGLRLALKAVEQGFKEIKAKGTQENIISDMLTRKELYDLLEYEDYKDFDKDIFNFKL